MKRMPGPLTDSSEEALLILASASPRRREILTGAWSGRLDVMPSGIDENDPKAGEPVATYAMRLAKAKAWNVAAGSTVGLVVAADTVVEFDGRVLGKPATTGEAREMLEALRGGHHVVTTGLALAAPGFPEVVSGYETTIVHMRRYSDSEIDAYVASGEPFDKAGGYAVQDPDFAPADRVQGCYLNVVGLPLCRLCELLSGARPAAAASLSLASCASCRKAASVREGVAAR